MPTNNLRLHFIVFLWGFTAVLGKLIDANALVLVFYRTFFAAMVLYIYVKFIKKQSLKVSRKILLQLVGIGSLMAFHWLFFFYSIKVSNVSIALSTVAFATIFAAVIEPLVFKRKLDWSEIVIGLLIIACMGLIFHTELKYKLGIILGIICAFLGALFSVFNGKIYGKTSSETMVFYEIFGGWLVLSLYYGATGQLSSMASISYKDLALILLLSVLFTAYPMFESIRLMKYISPFTLLLTVNLEPVYGIVLAFIIFGESEQMSPIFYIASASMISLIFVNGFIKARRLKKSIPISN